MFAGYTRGGRFYNKYFEVELLQDISLAQAKIKIGDIKVHPYLGQGHT